MAIFDFGYPQQDAGLLGQYLNQFLAPDPRANGGQKFPYGFLPGTYAAGPIGPIPGFGAGTGAALAGGQQAPSLGDPSGSTPLNLTQQQAMAQGIMPRQAESYPLAEDIYKGGQQQSAQVFRPGSIFDRLFPADAPKSQSMSARDVPANRQQNNQPLPENLGFASVNAMPVMPQSAPMFGDVPMPTARPSFNAPMPMPRPQESAPQSAGPPMPQQGMGAPQSGNFLDGIGNFLGKNSNTLMALGAGIAGGQNWGQGISMGLQGAMKGRQLDQAAVKQGVTRNAMIQALMSKGMAPAQAAAVADAAALDPKLAEALLPQALGLKPPTTMEAYLADKLHKRDNGVATNGVSASSPVAGSPQAATDPVTEYNRFLQGKSAAEKAGTVQGERSANAAIDLPGAVAQGQESLRLIDQIRKHPGRESMFFHSYGSNYLPDAAIPGGTDAFNANQLLNQIKGGAFLEAFKTLKGGGQITEVEGKKATEAISRLNRAQSKAEFDQALSDYEGIIRLGIDRANQVANRPAPYGFKGNQPETGPIKGGQFDWTPGSGLRKRGG